MLPTGGISSLSGLAPKKVSDLSKNTGELQKAAIYKIKDDGTIDSNNPFGKFLLNPNTWEETKTSNWSPQNIPGQSDQILQWMNSGPRTVSFTALITKDHSDKNQDNESEDNSAEELVGNLANKFFNVSVPTTVTENPSKIDLNISKELNYYRSLLYPIYDNVGEPNKLVSSPPLIALYAGTSLVAVPYGAEKITSNHDIWVVTDLKIRITKQLPNLDPMEASVSFQLTQYSIRSFDGRRFSTATKNVDATPTEDTTGFSSLVGGF